MKALFKLSVVVGTGQGVYSVYTNYIKRPPSSPDLHNRKNKKIVVVGGGIIGLSTAYYLS